MKKWAGLQDLETWAEDRLRLVEDLATESSGPRGPVGIFGQKMGDPWGVPVESYGLRLSALPEMLRFPSDPRFPNSIFSLPRQMVWIKVRPLSHSFWSLFYDWPPMFGPKTDQPSVDEARKHCGDTILDPRGSSRWGVTVLAKSQSSWQNILATFSPMFVAYFIFPNVLSLVSFVWHCSQPTISLDPWFLVCKHI